MPENNNKQYLVLFCIYINTLLFQSLFIHFVTRQEILWMKLGQDQNQCINIYLMENVLRLVLFVVLLLPLKIFFDLWLFGVSVYGDWCRNNIYLQH